MLGYIRGNLFRQSPYPIYGFRPVVVEGLAIGFRVSGSSTQYPVGPCWISVYLFFVLLFLSF